MAAQYDGGIKLTINNSQLAVAVFIYTESTKRFDLPKTTGVILATNTEKYPDELSVDE